MSKTNPFPWSMLALLCAGVALLLLSSAWSDLREAKAKQVEITARMDLAVHRAAHDAAERHGTCTRAEWRSSYNAALAGFTAQPSFTGTPTSIEDRHHLALQAAAFACDDPAAATMIVQD